MADARVPNRVRKLLNRGQVVFGTQCFTTDPAFVEIMGWTGFDFAIIDTEHAPTAVGATLTVVRACELTGMTPLVRVFDNTPALICKALDNGAQGIIVPHISTARQAEAVVRSAKFPPLGDRSACPFTRQACFGQWRSSRSELQEYYRKANEDLLVILLVEGVEGVKNTPDIVKIEGVDIIGFGAGDYCHAIGIPGATYEHPKLYGALRDVLKMCSEGGVEVLSQTAKTVSVCDAPYVKKILDTGVKVLYLCSDLSLFDQTCKEMITLKELL